MIRDLNKFISFGDPNRTFVQFIGALVINDREEIMVEGMDLCYFGLLRLYLLKFVKK